MAVQPVHRYSPYKTGPAAVPVPYRRDLRRYGAKQKSRNYIALFSKKFFSFFSFWKKFYIEERIKGLGIDTARKHIVRLR